MAYLDNIPQPNDQISVSQGQILANFSALKTLIDVNHITFDIPDQGKHKLVTFPDNAGPHATGATEINLNNEVDATSTYQEIYITRDRGGAENYPFTAGLNVESGYTILPSGLLLKWGMTPGFLAAGTNLINFPVVPTIPVFGAVSLTAPFLIIVSPVLNGAGFGNVIWDKGAGTTTAAFSIWSTSGNQAATWLALGTL
jgi:hypothetical protein